MEDVLAKSNNLGNFVKEDTLANQIGELCQGRYFNQSNRRTLSRQILKLIKSENFVKADTLANQIGELCQGRYFSQSNRASLLREIL